MAGFYLYIKNCSVQNSFDRFLLVHLYKELSSVLVRVGRFLRVHVNHVYKDLFSVLV